MPFDSKTIPPERAEKLRFFVFTCRGAESDFRLALAETLSEDHEVWYIWLKRRPIVTGFRPGYAPREMSVARFLKFMLGFRQDDKVNIYFDSTNTYFPGVMTFLRSFVTAGVWCMDMHDDLRYQNTGIKRLRESLIIRLQHACSHVTVNAAHTLAELFPKSERLGNASHLLPLARRDDANTGILIIASFDERFDMDFVTRLAELRPDMQFHLHGWIRPDLTEMFRVPWEGHANLHYHGAYTTADLPGILGAYRVTLAPYLADSIMTRYIDPLRYYHCLNAGLEVVSTDIPAARYMERWIHVVHNPRECGETLAAIQAGKLSKQPGYRPITWEQRADRLLSILRELPRTKILAARRPKHPPTEMTAAESGRRSAGG